MSLENWEIKVDKGERLREAMTVENVLRAKLNRMRTEAEPSTDEKMEDVEKELEKAIETRKALEEPTLEEPTEEGLQ